VLRNFKGVGEMKSKKVISFVMIVTMLILMFPSNVVANSTENVNSNESITKEYVIDYSVKNGKISTSVLKGQKLVEGKVVTFTVEPDKGYTFDYWIVKNDEGKILKETTERILKLEIRDNINVEAVIFKGNSANPTVDYVRKEVQNLNYVWTRGKRMYEACDEIEAKIKNLKKRLNLDPTKIVVDVVEIYEYGYIQIEISSPVEDKRVVVPIYSPEVLRIKDAIKEIAALNLSWDTDRLTTVESLKNNEELQNLLKKYEAEGLKFELYSDDLRICYYINNDSSTLTTGKHRSNDIASPDYEIFNEAVDEFASMNFEWTEDMTVIDVKNKIRKDTTELLLNTNKKLRNINSMHRVETVFYETYYKDDPNTKIVTALQPGLLIKVSSRLANVKSINLANPNADKLIEAYENADN
jgi:hypothetical protein